MCCLTARHSNNVAKTIDTDRRIVAVRAGQDASCVVSDAQDHHTGITRCMHSIFGFTEISGAGPNCDSHGAIDRERPAVIVHRDKSGAVTRNGDAQSRGFNATAYDRKRGVRDGDRTRDGHSAVHSERAAVIADGDYGLISGEDDAEGAGGDRAGTGSSQRDAIERAKRELANRIVDAGYVVCCERRTARTWVGN